MKIQHDVWFINMKKLCLDVLHILSWVYLQLWVICTIGSIKSFFADSFLSNIWNTETYT